MTALQHAVDPADDIMAGSIPVVSPNHPSTEKFVVNTRRHTDRERLRTGNKNPRLASSRISAAERHQVVTEATARAIEARKELHTARTMALRVDGQVGVGYRGIAQTLDIVPSRTPTSANTSAGRDRVDGGGNATPVSEEYVRLVNERARTIAELADLKSKTNRIPGTVMDQATKRLNMSPSHLRSLVRTFIKTNTIPVMDPRPRLGVRDMWQAKTAYFQANGNAALAYETLDADRDLDGMCLRTFQRVVNEWDPAIKAAAREGYRGLVARQMFNQEHIPFAGYAYGMDHTFLPIRVIPERGTKPVWVWLTTCIDLYSRVVLAYRLSTETPNTNTILDVFTDAVKGWNTPEGQFIGGKPLFIRSDRGGDFVSDALNAHLIDLEVEPKRTNPYSSWENGRTERLNGTLDRCWAPTVPGFYRGGADEYSRRVLKTHIPDAALVTLDDLDSNLGEYLGEYNNTERKSLGGITPLALWQESLPTHTPARASDDQLVAGLMTRQSRTIQHYGIETRSARYISADLNRLKQAGHRHITVAYHNHDHSFIYLISDGSLIGKAYRGGVEPEKQRYAIISMRRAQVREMKALMRAADRARVIQERERQIADGVAEKDLIEIPDLNYEIVEEEDDLGEENLDMLNARWAGETGVPASLIDDATGHRYDVTTGELIPSPHN